MTTEARQQLEELAKADASIKEHADAWLELDRRKRKRRDIGGLYALVAIGGLLVLMHYSSGPAIQGFVVGAAVIGLGWWYETRVNVIAREMDKLYWLGREAKLQRDALRAKPTGEASSRAQP